MGTKTFAVIEEKEKGRRRKRFLRKQRQKEGRKKKTSGEKIRTEKEKEEASKGRFGLWQTWVFVPSVSL